VNFILTPNNQSSDKSIVAGTLYKTTMDFFVVDLIFWKDSFALRRTEQTVKGRKQILFTKVRSTSNTVNLYNNSILMIAKDSFVVALGNNLIQSFLDEEILLNPNNIDPDYLNLIKAWLSTSCLLWNQTIYVPLINGESLFDCVEVIMMEKE
jgi:hypothetical protein